MDCCPICGGSGTERSRESVVKDGKLVDRVVMGCDHPSHGSGAFIRYDCITAINKTEERRKLEVNRQLYTKEDIQAAIETSDGNVAGIARALHISASAMWSYLGRYPELKLVVEERRVIGTVKRMASKLEEDKTLRKRRLEKQSSAVTPFMDRLVDKLDRVAREQRKARRQDRIRSKIASFEN